MKKKHEGEHDNLERWLLTYADLITLLLGLFVILYAMSKVDAEKFRAVAGALNKVFNVGKPQHQGGVLPKLPKPTDALNENEEKALFALKNHIAELLQSSAERGLNVEMTINERGLVIHLSEQLFFDSGRADLKPEGQRSLDQVAVALLEIPNEIRIEGHTDDVPIHTAEFPTNWHLSVARAVNTALYLIERHTLPPTRVAVAGYGEYRPLMPND